MGAVPPPPPLRRWSAEERHKALMDMRYAARNAARVTFPSEKFVIALLILSPWIVSVIFKLWLGDWTLYISPPHW